MSLPVKLYPPTLPPSYCITTLQSFVNLLFSQGRGEITTTGSIAQIIVDETPPGPDQRDYTWGRILDGVLDGWYEFKDGAWVTPHHVPPSDSPGAAGERRMWTGDLTALQTYDGGDSDPIGNASGPMWEEDPDFRGRILMGAGAIPDTTDTLAVSTNYGSNQVTLTQENLPELLTLTGNLAGWRTNLEEGASSDTPQWLAFHENGGTVGGTNPAEKEVTYHLTNTDGGTAFGTVPAVRGIYMIRRTTRKYRKST